MLMFQVFVNVGMNLGIMPITGIPLPLMSYGGSSVIVTFLAIGLLQSIYVQARLTSRAGHCSSGLPALEVSQLEEANISSPLTRVRPASRCSKARAARAAAQGGSDGARGRQRSRRLRRDDWKVAELYVERRGSRSIVGNIYKGVVDNVLPGHGGGVRRHRPGAQRLPARRRDRRSRTARRRRGAAAASGRRIDELIKPKPGGPRPGGQGPAEDEGRAPLDAALDRRAATSSTCRRAAGSAPRGGSRTPSATASASCSRRSTTATGGVIVRTAAQGARKEDFERDIAYLHKLHEVVERRAEEVEGAGAGLPGGRPLDPRRCATCSPRSSTARSSTTRSSTSG